jgi:hypothetical protein
MGVGVKVGNGVLVTVGVKVAVDVLVGSGLGVTVESTIGFVGTGAVGVFFICPHPASRNASANMMRKCLSIFSSEG